MLSNAAAIVKNLPPVASAEAGIEQEKVLWYLFEEFQPVEIQTHAARRVAYIKVETVTEYAIYASCEYSYLVSLLPRK